MKKTEAYRHGEKMRLLYDLINLLHKRKLDEEHIRALPYIHTVDWSEPEWDNAVGIMAKHIADKIDDDILNKMINSSKQLNNGD